MATATNPALNPMSDIVLDAFVAEWRVRLPKLAEYLNEQFGYVMTHPLSVERLVICEQADGTVMPENIGGRFRRKWVVTEGSVREVSLDFAWREMYDTDDSGVIYVAPSFLFCCQDDLVLLSERYGSGLTHRLRGRIIDARTQTQRIEWTTLWKGGRPPEESRRGNFWKLPRSSPRISRWLTLGAVGFLLVAPLLIAMCYLNGDVPAPLEHRRKFHPVFTLYEMGCLFSMFMAGTCAIFATTLAPSWKRVGLLAACIAAFIAFQLWLNSLRANYGQSGAALFGSQTRSDGIGIYADGHKR